MTLAITLNEAAEQAIPRLWLGPKGEVVDVAHEDVSHSKYVIDHPQTFGLTADMLVAAMAAEEVDFDWIIAKAGRATAGCEPRVISPFHSPTWQP